MPAEEWPHPSARYDRDAFGDESEGRWQSAIESGLEAGSLRLERVDRHKFDLAGACPRCGHDMRQYLPFRVVRQLDESNEVTGSGRFNITCNCDTKHRGANDDESGCGWAPSLEVQLNDPDRGLD